MKRLKSLAVIGLAALVATASAGVAAQQGDNDAGMMLAQAEQPAQGQAPAAPTPQQRVAMLKQWLQASQQQLRMYEWVETTVVTVGGEEKSRQQKDCYYDVNGTLQKIPVAGTEPAESHKVRGPLRKRAAANKKEEITEYMKSAAALVHSYIPPESNRIQQAVNSGNFGVDMVDPGHRTRLEFANYLKTGDKLSIDIEVPTNRLLGMSVSSYLQTDEDAVQLDVTMGVFPDGTIYTSKTQLAAPAEDIVVTIENTGHHRTGG